VHKKRIVRAVFALLASTAIASSGLRASASGSPSISECRGEASYTSTSLGIPFEVSFEIALREEGGKDLGWSLARTGPSPGSEFVPGFNAAATVYSVEFHEDIAIFVAVWPRGTSGALGEFFGFASNPAGTASVVGIRDGATGGFTDQVSEQFFFVPDQVRAELNDLPTTEALDDFGNPFPGFEGWTVRDYILQQLRALGGFPIQPGGDVRIGSAP
jgi:hypothetical protein